MSVIIKKALHYLVFFGIIVFAIWLSTIAKNSNIIKSIVFQYGYFGIFFTAIISGFNVLAPIPVIAFFPLFVVSGLNPWVTVSLIVVGMTISDMFAYYIGYVGNRLSLKTVHKKIDKLNMFLIDYRKASLVALFLFSAFVPFPNELLIMPMAFLGYRFFTLIIIVLFGNTIFNLIAMLGVVNVINYMS